jgi:hypothetical protein
MTRAALAIALCVLLSAGCGDRHRPKVRSVRAEPPQEQSPEESPPEEIPGHFPLQQAAAPSGPEVDLDAVRLTAPGNWVRKAPRVEFIRAEFSLPRSEGDSADGRLTVSVAGGSLEDNINRWRQQFAGKPEKESLEHLKASGIDVTLVDLSGTYNDQRGPFAPATECPGYRMLGAIFDVGGQLHFVKAYGPAKTMAARAGEFRAFVESLKLNKPAK